MLEFAAILWPIAFLATVIVGNYNAYQLRLATYHQNPDWFRHPPNWLRFLFSQLVLIIKHPRSSLGILGATLMFAPLSIFFALVTRDLFDFARGAIILADMDRRKEWQEDNGMPYRVCCSAQSAEDQRWRDGMYEADIATGEWAERLSLALSKGLSYIVLLFGLLMAPFGLVVKTASAKTHSEKKNERVIDPNADTSGFDPSTLLQIHGVIRAGMLFVVPTDGSETEMTWKLHQMLLNLSPKLGEDLSGFVLLDLAKLTDGPADPLLMANLTWRATDELSFTGGRIINPIGFARQPPPHKKIELSYPQLGGLASIFDHGATMTWKRKWFEMTAGALTGHGTTTEVDNEPDGLLQLRFHPTEGLLLGLDAQTGRLEDGWRHALGLHGEYQNDAFTTQFEVMSTFAPGNDTPSIAWWLMAAGRPAAEWELYARAEGLHDLNTDREPGELQGIAGINFRPIKNFALRLAAQLPFMRNPPLTLQLQAQGAF